MTEEPLQTQSASAPPDDVSRLSLVSEFINNEMAAEENLKLADPFTPNFGDAVSGETGGGDHQALGSEGSHLHSSAIQGRNH